MTTLKSRYYRYGLMFLLLVGTVYLALGYGTRSFESYCPFGGAESLGGLFTSGEFSCALGPLNLSLMIALVGLAVLSKKSFCGWGCPIGFLGELFGRGGNAVLRGRVRVNSRANFWLKLVRYVVLVLALYFTYESGELILRGYDPFYLLFSGIGHGSVGAISLAVIIVIGVGALIVPMMFCRYLCPLGAVFDPFAKLGLVKITRDENSCTACGNCTKACLHDIPVHTLRSVRHRDCTNCLECIDACPEKSTLKLQAKL